jgi:hypothetical protein
LTSKSQIAPSTSTSSLPIKVNVASSSLERNSVPSLTKAEKKHVKAEEASAFIALERRAQLG